MLGFFCFDQLVVTVPNEMALCRQMHQFSLTEQLRTCPHLMYQFTSSIDRYDPPIIQCQKFQLDGKYQFSLSMYMMFQSYNVKTSCKSAQPQHLSGVGSNGCLILDLQYSWQESILKLSFGTFSLSQEHFCANLFIYLLTSKQYRNHVKPVRIIHVLP